jgi:hypothetical protein
MTDENLNECLCTSVACDGATVMPQTREVQELLKHKVPSITVWQCANHRFQISISNTMKSVLGININRLKSLADKHVLYHNCQKTVENYKYSMHKLTDINYFF